MFEMDATLADWWDCGDEWTYATKNRTVALVKVWVNIIAATTPKLLQESMPNAMVGVGLSSRIIYVYEDKKSKILMSEGLNSVSKKTDFIKEHNEMEEKLIEDLHSIHLLKGVFECTEEYYERYVSWYKQTENDILVGNPCIDDEKFSGYVARRATHLRKLCMILSASRSDSMIIEEEDFDLALRILKETEVNMPATFSRIGRSNLAMEP